MSRAVLADGESYARPSLELFLGKPLANDTRRLSRVNILRRKSQHASCDGYRKELMHQGLLVLIIAEGVSLVVK